MFFVFPRKINVEGEKLAEELARPHYTCKLYEIDKFKLKTPGMILENKKAKQCVNTRPDSECRPSALGTEHHLGNEF
ncbi:hypothetical protein M3221_13990 [Domibacillus indicus]|uniref:hypothetical protein n=1 Tax=Domibacillus indicus TaxID=1437523 RepID=UPI00203BE49D|nr:hypothetical protein [Domibacillus indicus]MCM3789513.1 hypothetical protein [Domibacillus indicus]